MEPCVSGPSGPRPSSHHTSVRLRGRASTTFKKVRGLIACPPLCSRRRARDVEGVHSGRRNGDGWRSCPTAWRPTSAGAARNSTQAVNPLNENPSHSLSGSSPPRTRKRRCQRSDVITTWDPGTDGRAVGRTDGGPRFARLGTVGRTDGGARFARLATVRRSVGRTPGLASLASERSDSYIISHHIIS